MRDRIVAAFWEDRARNRTKVRNPCRELFLVEAKLPWGGSGGRQIDRGLCLGVGLDRLVEMETLERSSASLLVGPIPVVVHGEPAADLRTMSEQPVAEDAAGTECRSGPARAGNTGEQIHARPSHEAETMVVAWIEKTEQVADTGAGRASGLKDSYGAAYLVERGIAKRSA